MPTSLPYLIRLVVHLVRRDFRLRYTRSVLGVAWSVIVPLIHLLVLVFVFNRLVPLDIEAYPAFVFTGILPWTWFASSVGTSGALFLGNRDLMRRPRFPPAALIFVNTLSNWMTFFWSLPILFALLLWHGRALTGALLFLPILMFVEAMLIIGLSLILATVNVFYRDVQYVMGVLLSFLFYLTPVFYRPSQAGEEYAFIFVLNPMAVVVEGTRAVLFYGALPDAGAFFLASSIALTVLGLGFVVHLRHRDQVIDAL